jgi:transposase
MRLEVNMTTRKRRQFTAEFKADADKLVRTGGQSIAQVARNLDLTETALREWVRRAEIEAGEVPLGALTQAEREELVRLRRDNKRLQMERDILKKRPPTSRGRASKVPVHKSGEDQLFIDSPFAEFCKSPGVGTTHSRSGFLRIARTRTGS